VIRYESGCARPYIGNFPNASLSPSYMSHCTLHLDLTHYRYDSQHVLPE
jgi:hypothetical protein